MLLFLLAAAAQPSVTPPKGFIALVAAPEKDTPNRLCTTDRGWCVVPPEAEDGNLYVDKGTTGESFWSPPEGDGSSYELVPAIAPLKAGGALLLMQARRRAAYSGGGGEFADWVVLHVAKEGPVTRVLTATASGSLMIRACFSEKDMKQRAGACHDEYEMAGTLELNDDGSQEPPLAFMTKATFFPRGIRRDADSLSLPPLKKSDLAWQRDATCSYRRTFTYRVSQRQYAPDLPLPDCSQYLAD